MLFKSKQSAPKATQEAAPPDDKPTLFKTNGSEPQASQEVAPPATAYTPPPLPSNVEEPPMSEPDPQFQQRAARSKRQQVSFGEIVALLMRSSQFKSIPLAALEHLVVPPVAAGQVMIVEAQHKQTGIVAPAAAILWASVSDEVDQRLSEGQGKPLNLSPQDWKSGDNPWLVITAGDPRLVKSLVERLQKVVPEGKKLKSLSISPVVKQASNVTH